MSFWYKSADNYQYHTNCSCQAERQVQWTSCFFLFVCFFVLSLLRNFISCVLSPPSFFTSVLFFHSCFLSLSYIVLLCYAIFLSCCLIAFFLYYALSLSFLIFFCFFASFIRFFCAIFVPCNYFPFYVKGLWLMEIVIITHLNYLKIECYESPGTLKNV